jgi:hypothetical protein
MTFKVGDKVRIVTLDTPEEYDEDNDEYYDVDCPYVEDEMQELYDEDALLTITGISVWSGWPIANGYEWHPDWLYIVERKAPVELTGANASHKNKGVIIKVLQMQLSRKEKGYAF